MQASPDVLSRLSSDIDRDAGKAQDFFVRMLRVNAVNPRMGGPGEIDRANLIQSFLEGEGFEVSRVDAPDSGYKRGVRPNICTRVEGEDKSKTLWFLAHMDTVPEGSRELWNSDPFEPRIEDGKIFARGAEDNGQSLVSSLFALRELKSLGERLPFNVGAWFVADEECGSNYGVKYLLEHSHFRPGDLIVVPDAGSPSGTDIEIAEKNLLWFKVTTRGKQVHASLPAKGKNAHRLGMKLALALDESLHRRYPKRNDLFDDPSSTFEPTKIDPNVPNVNTIPGLDAFYFDCRVLPEYSLDSVLSDIRSSLRDLAKEHGADASLEIVQRDDAGPATSPTSEIARLVEKAVARMTRKRPRFVGIGLRTVGNFFRDRGIPTVVWSTVDDVPHEPNEYSRVASLISDAKVFAAIPLLADSR
ncbi:MAG: M20 family metallo-hydrolase [Nitrososphaerales archaeon]